MFSSLHATELEHVRPGAAMVGAAYDSLGYDGFHDWPMLQDRYTLAVLVEYAATLGLIGIEYVPPVGAPEDYRDNRGGDDLDQLSRYASLLALRLNPIGAYATGRAPAYIPAPPLVDTERRGIKVLPNFDIVASTGCILTATTATTTTEARRSAGSTSRATGPVVIIWPTRPETVLLASLCRVARIRRADAGHGQRLPVGLLQPGKRRYGPLS
ncbi:hypothetical protein AB0M87_16595 [Streptomyces sp. NPDC051320]|uniref:hypothetical protein n=1 Tax=Streptomyces sp. NPDC051320 TaxID=3154644 RepID=UPI003412B71B